MTHLLIALSMLAAPTFAGTKEIHVMVKGMVCGFCAQGITKKFSAEPSVEKVTVSLADKKVDLALKTGQELSDETIRKVLTEAGYTVEKIERK